MTDLISTIQLADEEATGQLARALAKAAQTGDNFLLYGDIGAGKSTFARAFIRYLFPTEVEIPSPTFTLVQTYSDEKLSLWHFDFYRLICVEDAIELGLEDALEQAISLIEWPDQVGFEPQKNSISIHFATEGPTHVANVRIPSALSPRFESALKK